MPGQLKADRYAIEQEIGHGGMGRVYRARDTRLGRPVALKMLPAEVTHDAELRRRLATEARAASALSHPGVATVYDFVEHADESFIIFEYVEGATLRERLARHRFSTEEILDIGVQLADALAVAHDRGIVHRDLKPENIMLVPALSPDPSGRVKILDFGLAKLREPLTPATPSASTAETATVSTAAGLIVGTVNYMSPEQLEGESADARADLYALGLVLYEMATGANPFLGKTPTSTIANILKLEPPPVVERNPVAPVELDRILRKCLRKRREERYQSARELLVDLANLRRDLVTPGRPATIAAEAPAPFAIPRGTARAMLIAIQVGYLAMYGAALANLEAVAQLSAVLYKVLPSVPIVIGFVLCGIAVRLYLLAALGFDYPDLGRKFRWLFPAVFLLDAVWAASPLLLYQKLGVGLGMAFVAGLAYLPLSQRWLLYDAYSPTGGRTSALKPPPYP